MAMRSTELAVASRLLSGDYLEKALRISPILASQVVLIREVPM